MVLIADGVLVVLLVPISIDVRWVGIPVAVALGILARLEWSYYKKHL